MESVYDTRYNCTGCGACRALCPVGAIGMEPDSEGFLYPAIDTGLCIDCGRCADACPLRRENSYRHAEMPAFYVARHRDEAVLRQSTSGGMFTALSDVVLDMGGAVYGADFDENLRVVHKRATSRPGRDAMRFSKYVQSDLGSTHEKIEADLRAGMPVLFTGTPCQNAGMRAFFEGSSLTDRLYLCDLICHSIPSPRIWEDYKALLEAECGGRLTHVQFRSKRHDWTRKNSNKGFLYSVEGDTDLREDSRFYSLFIHANSIVRPSCYACRFTRARRVSDITIADYWGIEQFAPAWYDPLGVSVALVNTTKGRELLDACAKALLYEQRPAEESLSQQKRLSEPAREPADRAGFWQAYDEKGLGHAIAQAETEK